MQPQNNQFILQELSMYQFNATAQSRLLIEDEYADLNISFHSTALTIVWCGLIDFTIILTLYQYRRYSIIIHAIAGIAALLLTMLTSFKTLIDFGFIQHQTIATYHFIEGTVIYVGLLSQVGLGMATRIMRFMASSSSLTIYRINKIHKYLGYATLVICKAQIISIRISDDILTAIYPIAQTVLFIILLTIRKINFSKLQNIVHPEYIDYSYATPISNTKSLEEENIKFVLFANYVYDLEPMKRDHPVGIEVIQSVSGRDIDRYVYGMYTSEKLIGLPMYSHSFKSLALLGKPIHKLEIKQLFHVFQPFLAQEKSLELIQCRVSSINIVSQQGQIYEIHIKPSISGLITNKEGKEGYTQLNQLGRYHSLTINSTTTRLYTEAFFITHKNRRFLKKHLQFGGVVPLMNGENQVEMMDQHEKQDYIPFLMRKYDTGILSSSLIDHNDIHKIEVSESKGAGLEFGRLYESGKGGLIILVAGGTGLYPFSDLIDLLFKAKLMKNTNDPKLHKKIFSLSPILQIHPFDSYKFHLMASFNYLEDIHPITFAQLKYLAKLQNQKDESSFKVSIRIKDKSRVEQIKYCDFEILLGRFENLLKQKLTTQSQNLRKIYICGPPLMNQSMAALMIQQGPSFSDKYLLM